MSSVDGGSASPPTADVPMRVLSLRVSERLAERVQRAAAVRGWDTSTYIRSLLAGATATVDTDQTVTCSAPLRELEIGGVIDHSGGGDWWPPGCACTLTESGNAASPINLDDSACPIHSGVAGEPEATTKKASEIAVAVSTTPTHAPTPETPGAVNVAGGMAVPDEAVEAAARADHAFGRLGDDPDWDGLMDTDRDSYRRAASSYLTAAAPLIAAQALRDARYRYSAMWTGGDDPDLGDLLLDWADELERDDGVTPMVGTVTADDLAMISRATGTVDGGRTAELVPEVEPEPCEACGASEATGWPSMCAGCRERFNAWRADELERGGDR